MRIWPPCIDMRTSILGVQKFWFVENLGYYWESL